MLRGRKQEHIGVTLCRCAETTRLDVRFTLGSVHTHVQRNAFLSCDGSNTMLHVAKGSSGRPDEAFAELSVFFTGVVDQDVCTFLRELYIDQVLALHPADA